MYKFLKKICVHFQAVLYIPGNHEFYKIKDMEPIPTTELYKKLNTLESSIPNLHILNRNSVKIGNYCIIGCTLWSLIPENGKLPTYRVRINDITKYKYNKNYMQDLQYIKDMIAYCKNKKLKLIVVTHYPPSLKCLNIKHERDKFEYLYATNLENIVGDSIIHTWICGHVHWNFNFKIKNTNLLSNQKGRIKDGVKTYNPKFTLEFL